VYAIRWRSGDACYSGVTSIDEPPVSERINEIVATVGACIAAA